MKQLKEVLTYEIVGMCRYKVAKGRKKFTLYLDPKKIPPFNPLKAVEVEDEVAGLVYRIYTRPSEEGGWLLHVVAKEIPFNPVLKENPCNK